MGVKPKHRVKGGKSRVVIATKDETVTSDIASIDYPVDGLPYSSVGVTLGMKLSKPDTFCSATCDIHVSLPCNPGEEEAACKVALQKANDIFSEYQEFFEKTVDSL